MFTISLLKLIRDIFQEFRFAVSGDKRYAHIYMHTLSFEKSHHRIYQQNHTLLQNQRGSWKLKLNITNEN